MPEMMKKLSKRMPSRELSPEEEEVRKRAEEFRKSQGTEDVEPEEGIEEQDLEDVVPYGSTIAMATPLGAGKKLLRKGATELAEHPGMVRKLAREMPLFSEAKAAGETKPFAKFIREGEHMAEKEVPEVAKESVKVGRFETGNKRVKELQEELQTLAEAKTPETRARKEEIKRLLANRTYFSE